MQEIPFLRILTPFILGIVLFKICGNTSFPILIGCAASALLTALIFQSFSFTQKIKWFWINGLALQLFLICLGYGTAYFNKIEHREAWYRNHMSAQSKFRASILSPLKETKKTFKTKVSISEIYNGQTRQTVCGKAILYFLKSNEPIDLDIGDEILLSNKLKPISNKGNPGEFDCASFSQNRGLYDQAFLTTNEWKKISTIGFKNTNLFNKWHEYIKSSLACHIKSAKALGIAQALITGYRDDIDKELYSSYSKTGLVHLLAISGLHMGIFFLGTQSILSLVSFFRSRKRTTAIIALVCMWFFALVTTFPPSVQRASIMMSFLVIGQLTSRKVSSLNFLLASAFFLLMLQPYLLWEIGFQLSYAAVLGILLFYKTFRKWYAPRNSISKKVWEIICVSLSAQLFTLPISLYYFHHIPTLFLITNIIAIPLITIIIYSEIVLIMLSFIPPVAKLLGIVVSVLIESLNEFVRFTAKLSFANLEHIHINLVQCIILLTMLFALSVWFLNKRKEYLPISLALFICFSTISIIKKSTQLQQEKLIVYNSSQPYLEYIKGKSYYSRDTVNREQRSKFEQYTLAPSHIELGLKGPTQQITSWEAGKQLDFLTFANKKILRIKKAYKIETIRPIEVDYLIISDQWIKDSQRLLARIRPKEIIIDGNIPVWKIQDLKSQLQEVDLPTHYISTQGAKIIQL